MTHARHRWAGLLLWLACATGCAPPILLDTVIARARDNEVAAVRSTWRRRVQVTGTVVVVTFQNRDRVVMEQTGSAAILGQVAVGSSQTTARTLRTRRPYAQLSTSDGTQAFCYLADDEDAETLSKGWPARLVGSFLEFTRGDEGQLRATLTECRVVPDQR